VCIFSLYFPPGYGLWNFGEGKDFPQDSPVGIQLAGKYFIFHGFDGLVAI
jgi:hypothetical protein